MVDLGLMMTILEVSMYDWMMDEERRSPKLEPGGVLYFLLKALASQIDSEMDD